MKRTVVAVAWIALAVLSCKDPSGTGNAADALVQIDVSPSVAHLDAVGATVALKAAGLSQFGVADPELTVEWSTNDAAVATVDASGTVTAVANGSAAITATAAGVEGSATVVVRQQIFNVSIATAQPRIRALGFTAQFQAAVLDSKGATIGEAPIYWATGDTTIADVSAAGLVTARGVGATRVYVFAFDDAGNTFFDTATVEVVQVPETVEIVPSADSVVVGDSITLTATVRDSNSVAIPDAQPSWASSDVAIATVSQTGTVRGVAEGTATITVSAAPASATATVTVLQPVASVVISPDSASLLPTDTQQFTATLRDAGGNIVAGQTVTWRTLDTLVATVDTTGLVTGRGTGSTTLVATAGGKADSAGVVVGTATASLTLSRDTATLQRGETLQLTATLRAADGSVLTDRRAAWTTSSAAVATVDTTGFVTAVASGSADIVASREGKADTARITVPYQGIEIVNYLYGSVDIDVGGVTIGTVAAQATDTLYIPVQSSLPEVSWTLNNQTTSGGTEVGDDVGGTFPVRTTPALLETYYIDNVVGSTTYFAPFVQNNSSYGLLMGVNMGTVYENRCNCVVPAGSDYLWIGYYRHVSGTTTVRAYQSGSGYTGGYVYWSGLDSFIQANSGRTNLIASASVSFATGTVSLPAAPEGTTASSSDAPSWKADPQQQDRSRKFPPGPRQAATPPSSLLSPRPPR